MDESVLDETSSTENWVEQFPVAEVWSKTDPSIVSYEQIEIVELSIPSEHSVGFVIDRMYWVEKRCSVITPEDSTRLGTMNDWASNHHLKGICRPGSRRLITLPM